MRRFHRSNTKWNANFLNDLFFPLHQKKKKKRRRRRRHKDRQDSVKRLAIAGAAPAADGECSSLLSGVGQADGKQLARSASEFPVSSRSHLAVPAPRAIKHHKAHHCGRSKMCVYRVKLSARRSLLAGHLKQNETRQTKKKQVLMQYSFSDLSIHSCFSLCND